MKSLMLCFCTCVLLYGCSTSRPSFVMQFPPTPPDTLRAMTVDVDSYEQRYGSEHASVFLLWEQNQEITWAAERYFVRTTSKKRILVLDPTKEDLWQIRPLLTKNEVLAAAAITVRYPNGTVRHYTEKDMRQEAGSKYTAYKLAYPDITRGTIIEEWISTVLEYDKDVVPNSYEQELQFSTPADTVVYRFLSPSSTDIQVKHPAPGRPVRYTLYIDDTHDMAVLHYHNTNVPATYNESYSPYDNAYRDRLDFRLQALYTVFTNKSLQSWDDFANDYKGLVGWKFGGEYRYDDLVDSLLVSCSTPTEKFKTIVAYVQREYEAVNGTKYWTLDEQKVGNNVEVTCFARYLLELADIEADLLLIQPEQEGYFDSTYYSGYQFYIPAVYALVDGRHLFAFPYRKHVPVGLIPGDCENRPAVRIEPYGFRGFIQTPRRNAGELLTDERITLTIDGSGRTVVEEERTLRGFEAVDMRNSLYQLHQQECDRELRNLATYIDGDTRFVSQEVLHLHDIDSALVIRLRYEVDNIVALSRDAAVLQTSGLLAPRSPVLDPTTPRRHNPVQVRWPWSVNKHIVIRYPEQWSVYAVPAARTLSNTFGSRSATFSSRPGELTARLHQVVQKAAGTQAQYRELLDLIGDMAEPAVPPLVFSIPGS